MLYIFIIHESVHVFGIIVIYILLLNRKTENKKDLLSAWDEWTWWR